MSLAGDDIDIGLPRPTSWTGHLDLHVPTSLKLRRRCLVFFILYINALPGQFLTANGGIGVSDLLLRSLTQAKSRVSAIAQKTARTIVF
jgi:hypothetical protein